MFTSSCHVFLARQRFGFKQNLASLSNIISMHWLRFMFRRLKEGGFVMSKSHKYFINHIRVPSKGQICFQLNYVRIDLSDFIFNLISQMNCIVLSIVIVFYRIYRHQSFNSGLFAIYSGAF